MNASERAELRRGLLWISPWIIGTLLFLVVPVAMSIGFSFTDYSLLDRPAFIGGENYSELARDPLFWMSLRNTGVYMLASTILGTLLAVLVAVLLEQRLRGAGAVRAIVFLPTLVPLVAASIGWLWLFNAERGLLNRLLSLVGLSGPNWLGDPAWAMPSLIIMSLWTIGSAVVILTAALREVPTTLYEAADLDGMGPLTRFRTITLPMISPTILFNAIVSCIWGLQVFGAPLIMTRGGPQNSTLVYSMYIFKNAFEYGRMGYASALAWIQFLVAIALTTAALLIARRLVHYRAA